MSLNHANFDKIRTSPWGAVQHQTEIIPGMTMVHTAGHGGIHLDRKLYAKMPVYMKTTSYSSGGWYEEDCDWCLPFVVFQAEILAQGDEFSRKAIASGAHTKTFLGWHKERAEKWFAAHPVKCDECGTTHKDIENADIEDAICCEVVLNG